MDLNEKEPVIPARRAKRLYTILAIAVIAILLAYGAFAVATSGKESTDDAQVAADIVPVASRVPGQVIAVHVVENQPVTRGTLIAELDPRDLEVKLAQAEGELET
ncbi:MAG: biotin/lipoyl-binding protein, partial [Acidobacteriota bacterium]|nr:biotin/lipoyl-binding protein [Acidobacteriota bacterium]